LFDDFPGGGGELYSYSGSLSVGGAVTWRSHFLLELVPSRSANGSSITKSARTCAFKLVLVRYSISYSLNSMAHFASQPDWVGLCRMILIGWDIIITMVSVFELT